MGHIRAVSNAHHCYWVSKDLAIFILDTLLLQHLRLPDAELDGAARSVETHGPLAPRAPGQLQGKAMELASIKEQVGRQSRVARHARGRCGGAAHSRGDAADPVGVVCGRSCGC